MTMTATHTDSPAQAAFRDYATTGETIGLLALADYLDERGERKAFAKLLRRVAKRRDPDIAFFYAHHGVCFTDLAIGLRSAVDLAKAEDWREDHDAEMIGSSLGAVWVEWEQDDDYDPTDADVPMPEIGWGCTVRVCDGANWGPRFSLWSITFAGDGWLPDRDPYKRVVEAELCLEAMTAKR
jgi:hypothetical protein